MKRTLTLLFLATAACRGSEAAGKGAYADKVEADVPKIEQALGVKFKTPPKLEVRSRDQVRDPLGRPLAAFGIEVEL